jgi:hypothetical protein
MLLSGLYPAVYISPFPAGGHFEREREVWATEQIESNPSHASQFVSAFTTIVGCFVYMDNNLYLKNKDWGYDHHPNIVVPACLIRSIHNAAR